MIRRAKIIATIGPASNTPAQLQSLIDAGMDVARLNFSHGTHQEHAKVIDHLRNLAKKNHKPLGILMDLQGPRIRTGKLADQESIPLHPGTQISLTPQQVPESENQIQINYPNLSGDVKKGDRILLDDGHIELRVAGTEGGEVLAEVISGGELGSCKGVNIPGVALSVPALTEKDKRDLAFGLRKGVDAIAISFVRRPTDIKAVRQTLQQHTSAAEQIPLIAKLEHPEAVRHLDAILEHSEGVMVARGDLGVEVSPEEVPSLQKRIIQRANAKRRLVIIATQMLESMIHNPRPSRAEASDIANAVFDGSDALMLSGETAVGKYPLQVVQTMVRIIQDAESHAAEWGVQQETDLSAISEDAVATTQAACTLAEDRNVAAVAVFTRSGRTARLMAKTRPQKPIYAFTPEEKTFHRLAFLWGTEGHLVPMSHSVEEMISHVQSALVDSGRLRSGQQVVIVASLPIGAMGPANFSLLHTLD